MAESGISVVENLIEVLDSKAIEDAFQMWNYISELEYLKQTFTTIHKLLLDADSKRDLDLKEQHFIDELKDVVYVAKDFFDEIRTLADLNQLESLNKVDRIIAKVRSYFPSKNPVVRLYKRSREVMDIKSKLVSIADNHKKFGFSFDYKPIVRRREETCSYVDVKDIIGRDEDKENIVDKLLDPSGNENVCFLTIVGMGGLGKTALAQLVFDDDRIEREFLSFRYWVCVSDIDGVPFDVKTILCRILEQVTQKRVDGISSLEVVRNQFLEHLKGKKYFLILDDVWNEDRVVMQKFRSFMTFGEKGSRIVITTRSKNTATNIGSEHVHELQALSQMNSRCLFEMSAFRDGEKNDKLVEIGNKIVEKCDGSPLVIKVVGTFLYGQDISKWKSIEDGGFGEIYECSDRIFSTLKLSYNNLRHDLKDCLRFCAIFPKDFRIDKEMLMSLWIAQEFVPSKRGQSVEDVAEEYFSTLMQRCFFQAVKNDRYGNIKFVKFNDLMYDTVQEVGKEEICVLSSNTDRRQVLGDKIRHVRYDGDGFLDVSLSSKIYSYVGRIAPSIDNCTCLKVLDVSRCEVKRLPNSIGMLLQLRYLNLSHNYNLRKLCDSISNLYNLQVLDLFCCKNLREIPKGISNLVNLRHFNLDKCDMLTYMPSGVDKLTNLRILPLFIVGNLISNEKSSGEGTLKDLETLRTIRGKICIRIGSNYETVKEDVDKTGGCLKSMNDLKEIRVEFKDDDKCAYDPDVMFNNLEPPRNIKEICLHNYKGTRLGRWRRAEHKWSTSHPSLVHIKLWKCVNLQEMPVLSELPHLKTLSLFHLDNLEYMENAISDSCSDQEVAAKFFPSLESIYIMWMERLKGWWKEDDVGDVRGRKLRFPCLKYLEIYKFPNLMSFAPCPSPESMPKHELPCLHSLKIADCPNLAVNVVCPIVERLEVREISGRSQITCGNSQDDAKLRYVEVDNVGHLKSLSTNCLTRLYIHQDSKVESLSVVEDAFQSCASSLRELEIRYCPNLRDLSGLEHLTALEELKLIGNNQLSISGEEEEPWKNFHQILHLKFNALPKMKCLSKGMRYLTSLQTLELRWCENLEELPEWISHLSSLKSLSIFYCPRIRSLPEAMKELTSLKNLSLQHVCHDLYKRCKIPDGEDLHKIQHILNKFISE